MRGIFIVVAVFLLASSVTAQVTYSTYKNDRFGYSIEYPSSFVMQEAPVNNDGRTFLSKDGSVEMRVWGQHNSLSRSLQEEFDAAVKDFGGEVTYKRRLRDGFVISGTKNGRIFYQKTLYHKFKSTDVFFTFTLEYPSGQRRVYDAVVEKIARSFRFDPNFDV